MRTHLVQSVREQRFPRLYDFDGAPSIFSLRRRCESPGSGSACTVLRLRLRLRLARDPRFEHTRATGPAAPRPRVTDDAHGRSTDGRVETPECPTRVEIRGAGATPTKRPTGHCTSPHLTSSLGGNIPLPSPSSRLPSSGLCYCPVSARPAGSLAVRSPIEYGSLGSWRICGLSAPAGRRERYVLLLAFISFLSSLGSWY